MEIKYEYKRLDRSEITEEQFKQVLNVERSDGEDDSYSEETMRELLIEDAKNSNFICTHNDNIVGYISLNPLSKRRNGSIYIISLVVLPEYRKKGIAKNLIYTACKYYENKEFGEIMSLQVDRDNIPALSLYKKMNFEVLDPICESDEDDEQYIMASDIKTIIKVFEKNFNK